MKDNAIDEEEIIICRCEEITLGEIKNAISKGAHDTDSVKRMTRAGMGLCQNKACYNLIARVISNETGKSLSQITPFKVRPPVRPIEIKHW